MGPLRDHVGTGRYTIVNKLGEGGMGAVYRAVDRLTGTEVAVKRLVAARADADATVVVRTPGASPSAPTELAIGTAAPTEAIGAGSSELSGPGATRNERPSPAGGGTGAPPPSDSVPAARLAIATEFRILASLRHPNIISVLDYGFDDVHDPYLVLEVLDDARSITAACRGQDLRTRVGYLGQLLRALHYLHRRGIRHRDLKPSNVMVAGGRVRVLDFGLALDRNDRHRPAGTYGYIAPEILRGEPATAASDLWSAGVLAYEVLASRHPFGRTEEEAMRNLGAPPHLVLDERELGVAGTAALVDTVRRLMAHRPEERPSSAAQALRLLARTGVLEAPEDDDVRRSLVAGARLVGRGGERGQLRAALSRARAGHGGVVMISGELGSGKSRLVDDLRTHALVSGCTVVQGSEVEAGGHAYQAWRAPLRRLALELTAAAPVPWPFLTLIVPDIGELLGLPPLALPPMDPQTLQLALMSAVEALVRSLTGPTVILLEDLHWAGGESLALLGWLTRVAAESRLLIVATTRAEVPGQPGVETIKLGRMSRSELEELAVAVLGPLGDRPDLIELLATGTGGVPLYVVEALRLLAAQAGSLDEIGTMRLPASLAIDVLDRALRERLARLPAHARPLIELAATVGLELELALLGAIAPELDLTGGLAAAEQAGLVAVGVTGWSFTHERVRQVVLDELPAERRRALHRQVAAHLEEAGDAVALAHHWGQAGDGEREGTWAAAAGEALLTRGSYLRALTCFERALALLPARHLDDAARDRAELGIQLGVGTCALVIHGFAAPPTVAAYDRAAALCETLGVAGGAQAFLVLFGQSAVHLFRADPEASRQLATRALAVAREAGDVDLELEGRFALSNAEFWCGDLASCERNVQRVIALWAPERAALHAERFNQVPRVTCMTGGAWGAWVSGRPDLALARAEEAVDIARAHGHAFSEAIAVQIVAFVRAMRRDVEATLVQAEALIRFGAPYPAYLVLASTLRAWAQAQRERDPQFLNDMLAAWHQWKAMGQGGAHSLMCSLLADAYLLFGRPAEALDVARECIAWIAAGSERVLLADLQRLEGEALRALGDVAGARVAFARALATADRMGAGSLGLRTAVAWAALEEAAGDPVEARAVLVAALAHMREGADTVDQRQAQALLARL
ncbi:MAG TPA: AAA family ATPase [Kofleriaceae bacterium]|nr:AAA family ATPase [Kofleriaceae bacterium]